MKSTALLSDLDQAHREILAACIVAISNTEPSSVNIAQQAWALYDLIDDDRIRNAGSAIANKVLEARNNKLTKMYEEYYQEAQRYKQELEPLLEMLQNNPDTRYSDDVAQVIVMTYVMRSPHSWLEIVAAATEDSIAGARDRNFASSNIAHKFMDEHPEVIERLQKLLRTA